MILIQQPTTSKAWTRTIRKLLASPHAANDKYFRDEPAVIAIEPPFLDPVHPLFPISQRQIKRINHYMVTGENETAIRHEWTKIYRHRLFDEPYSQIDFILNQLCEDSPHSSCHASIWDKSIDQQASVKPCAQIVWARIRHGKLDLYVHAHSSDAYGKLLMNLQQFVALHLFLSERSGFPVGAYRHFIDSCHLLERDALKVIELSEEQAF